MQDAGAGGQGGGAGCLTKDDSCRTLALAAKAVGLAARGDLGDFYDAYVLGALKSLRRLQVRCLAPTSCPHR